MCDTKEGRGLARIKANPKPKQIKITKKTRPFGLKVK
jgi:hypothetical protein